MASIVNLFMISVSAVQLSEILCLYFKLDSNELKLANEFVVCSLRLEWIPAETSVRFGCKYAAARAAPGN